MSWQEVIKGITVHIHTIFFVFSFMNMLRFILFLAVLLTPHKHFHVFFGLFLYNVIKTNMNKCKSAYSCNLFCHVCLLCSSDWLLLYHHWNLLKELCQIINLLTHRGLSLVWIPLTHFLLFVPSFFFLLTSNSHSFSPLPPHFNSCLILVCISASACRTLSVILPRWWRGPTGRLSPKQHWKKPLSPQKSWFRGGSH